ncbi:hypothetical protein [Caulobacter henricii]|uniref:Uncharacterized protein n=1 Tax=Caulobacter henricii TaxID=69395 RepID=A0A0P0P1M5_9CAUL|nr:hypothetical protein [Caulobacter henricii]ALL14432.1 hypothetical protein AQ619_14360 [Caulobacter henricii]
MADSIEAMIDRLRALEEQLEAAFAVRAGSHGLDLKSGKPRFGPEVRASQRGHKRRIHFFKTPWPTLLTLPLIYGMVIPMALMDLAVSVYQLGCFTAWGIERVRRRDYVVIDRHRLSYLNPVQKLNCVYCGYGNGVIAYAREITARTEQYWCPIKHALKVKGSHERYAGFLDYGDAEGFVKSSAAYRERLKKARAAASVGTTKAD